MALRPRSRNPPPAASSDELSRPILGSRCRFPLGDFPRCLTYKATKGTKNRSIVGRGLCFRSLSVETQRSRRDQTEDTELRLCDLCASSVFSVSSLRASSVDLPGQPVIEGRIHRSLRCPLSNGVFFLRIPLAARSLFSPRAPCSASASRSCVSRPRPRPRCPLSFRR